MRQVIRRARHARTAGEGLFFRQILQSPEFTEFALILKRLTGLSMALNTPDVGSTTVGVRGDKGNPLCRFIRASPEGARRCEACDRRHHAIAGAKAKAQVYTCHAGFIDMAIPIIVQGEHIATISSGQVLPAKPSAAAFARLANRLRWLNVPEQRLRAAYDRAPWMPRARVACVMQLLDIVARQTCDSAMRIRELEANREHPAARTARALVEERFADSHLQLSEAAAAAGLSRAHFSHLFHKETGLTFTHYVQNRRIAEAKRLLTETPNRITDICFACGFESLTHFNRVFRRDARCSPSQFRKQER